MAKVRCYECNRSYDYYEDGFCPRCGCFNQPPRSRRIDATGNIIYHDGINEKNHEGSFVHKEYHRENRKRAFTKLEAKQPRIQIHATRSRRASRSANPEEDVKIASYIIYAVIFFIFIISRIL